MIGVGVPELLVVLLIAGSVPICWALDRLGMKLRFGYRWAAITLVLLGLLFFIMWIPLFINFALPSAAYVAPPSLDRATIVVYLLLLILPLAPVCLGIISTFTIARIKFDGLDADPIDCIRWQTKNQPVCYSPKKLFMSFLLYTLPVVFGLFLMLANLPLWLKPFLIAGGGYLLAGEIWPIAKRWLLASADEAMRRDNRRPTLLLRSFKDDRMYIKPPLLSLSHTNTNFEELLTGQLWCHGPVIAIGRPGEIAPLNGAARNYYTDDTWQVEAESMVREARSIFMIVGDTSGLGWEMRRIRDLGMTDKLDLVFPPVDPNRSRERWDGFCSQIDDPQFSDRLCQTPVENLLLASFVSKDEIVFIGADKRTDVNAYTLGFAAVAQRNKNSIGLH